MSWNFFRYGPRPVLIAHRGASGYAPENTLAAFKMALDMGARFIEMDVHQTKDGHPVVIHDEDLKRTAGVKKKVQDLTLEELQKYSAGSKFNRNFSQERVPSLEETLALISRRAVVDVEIKGDGAYPGIEEKVVSILERKGYNGMSFITSTHADTLRRAREASSVMPLGLILGRRELKEVLPVCRELGCHAVVLSARQAGQKLIQTAHQRALHVCVYTVNSKKEWEKFSKLRVDAMFTDYPDLMGSAEFEQASVGLTSEE